MNESHDNIETDLGSGVRHVRSTANVPAVYPDGDRHAVHGNGLAGKGDAHDGLRRGLALVMGKKTGEGTAVPPSERDFEQARSCIEEFVVYMWANERNGDGKTLDAESSILLVREIVDALVSPGMPVGEILDRLDHVVGMNPGRASCLRRLVEARASNGHAGVAGFLSPDSALIVRSPRSSRKHVVRGKQQQGEFIRDLTKAPAHAGPVVLALDGRSARHATRLLHFRFLFNQVRKIAWCVPRGDAPWSVFLEKFGNEGGTVQDLRGAGGTGIDAALLATWRAMYTRRAERHEYDGHPATSYCQAIALLASRDDALASKAFKAWTERNARVHVLDVEDILHGMDVKGQGYDLLVVQGGIDMVPYLDAMQLAGLARTTWFTGKPRNYERGLFINEWRRII